MPIGSSLSVIPLKVPLKAEAWPLPVSTLEMDDIYPQGSCINLHQCFPSIERLEWEPVVFVPQNITGAF